MKTFALGCIGIWLLVALFVGCTTSSQRTAFNTIGSIETAANAALDTYDDAVIRGQITTNSLPTVAKAYNDLQHTLLLAAAIDKAGTNALSTPDIEAELGDFVNLVSALTKK